jgi:D-alanyl-D-alanine dipeptidase
MQKIASRLRGIAVSLTVLLALTAAPGTAQARGEGKPEPRAPKEVVALRDVDRTILEENRYFTPHNFIGDPIDGYKQPMCVLTRAAAEALRAAQAELRPKGYTLKVYDCYRPQRAVNHFVRWAKDLDDQRMKAEFYPRVDKSTLFDDGYIAERSGHSRGSTVDLTIVKLPARPTKPYHPGQKLVSCFAPQAERFPDNSVDMGTGYDCFDTLSHTLDPRIVGKQRANRLLLKNTLEDVGFVNYENEWWHFTYRPETFPDTYFDFPVSRDSLVPRS